MIVAVEGTTQAGKTTLCRSIVGCLRAAGVAAVDLNPILEVDPVLEAVRAITHPVGADLSAVEELLFYSVRLARKANTIRKFLAHTPGGVAVVDRYAASLIALSCGVRGLSESDVRSVLQVATAGTVPDVTVLLKVSQVTVLDRLGNGPRSRKNVGLENYFDRYETCLEEWCRRQGKVVVVVADNIAPTDLASELLNTIGTFMEGGHRG